MSITLYHLGGEIELRPSFAALVHAEEEVGPLFALVERAAAGQMSLREMTALFWHCAQAPEGMTRDQFSEAVMALGIAKATPTLKKLIGVILSGGAA
jgi:hypothetical protein